jgi:Ca2+-dependent lipid-binding protein
MGFLTLDVRLSARSKEAPPRDPQRRSTVKFDVSSSDVPEVPDVASSGVGANSLSNCPSGLLMVVLREGTDLLAMDDNGTSDPYVKLKLGNQKRKSKVKSNSLNPRWFQHFEFQLDNLVSLPPLLLRVYDRNIGSKDDFIGCTSLDLRDLTPEKTHHLNLVLEEESGSIKLSLTITGSSKLEAFTEGCQTQEDIESVSENFRLLNSFSRLQEVGWLQVKVFKAMGLKTADFTFTSDPYAIVKLVNSRVQTHTVYKSVDPEWNKVFTMIIRDIGSILEVTVMDENRNSPPDFLGRVTIPLLSICRGEKNWFQLKDEKLRSRVKGCILMELDLVYNPLRASLRSFFPKEEFHMREKPKLKWSVMRRNMERMRNLLEGSIAAFKLLQELLHWETPWKSLVALLAFILVVWFFQLYMIPSVVLLILVKSHFENIFKGKGKDKNYKTEFEETSEKETEHEAAKHDKRPSTVQYQVNTSI